MTEIDFEKDGLFPESPPTEETTQPESEVSAPMEAAPPIAPPPEVPTKPRKKGLRVAVIALAAVLALGVTAALAAPTIIKALNPKAAVLAALSKTMDNAGFDDAAAVLAALQKGAMKQTVSFHLGDQYPQDLDAWGQDTLGLAPGRLAGSGILCTIEMDQSAKEMALSFGTDIGTYRAADIQLFANNNTLSFGSPELTGGKFYRFNTETFGADWNASPYWSSIEGIDPEMSFNLFDLTAPSTDGTAAATELLDAATVTKDGESYLLTIPADALGLYLFDVTHASLDVDDITELFPDGLTFRFDVKKGAVTEMSLALPFTAGTGDLRLFRLNMTATEADSLSFLLENADSEGNVDISASTEVRVSTDKATKQVAIDLPEISILTGGERLTIDAGITMEPLAEFSFRPEDAVSFMDLDQNGVLELLLGALGSLQVISQGVNAG